MFHHTQAMRRFAKSRRLEVVLLSQMPTRENSNANSCILETYFLSTVGQSMPIFSRRRVFRGIVVHFPLILYVCPSVFMSEGGGFAKPFAWRAGL